MKFLNLLLFFVFISMLFLYQCGNQPSSAEKAPIIKINFVTGNDITGDHNSFMGINKEKSLEKSTSSESIEQVKVMILDFTMYDSSAQYFASDDFKQFSVVRDTLYAHDKLKQWDEWVKLLGDYFRIVANTNLQIEGDHAHGVVAGIDGLNYVFVQLIGHGEIQYGYEGQVYAKAGETVQANLINEW